MSGDGANIPSPIESGPWPDRLDAHVVTPGAEPRVHGIDVESDLARHYRFAETIHLALVGEPPTDAIGAALDVLLTFLAPAPAPAAPPHAAVLARTCAATTSAITATAAIGLAEQARATLAEHAAFLEWLAGDRATSPPRSGPERPDDTTSVARLRAALGGNLALPSHPLSRTEALLAGLFECGLRRAEQLEVAWVVARMTTAIAEALAHPRGALRAYPMNVPPIRYEEP
ncbi:MAG: hypothetical protein NVSMB47_02730 [Polyangiales bacterium]